MQTCVEGKPVKRSQLSDIKKSDPKTRHENSIDYAKLKETAFRGLKLLDQIHKDVQEVKLIFEHVLEEVSRNELLENDSARDSDSEISSRVSNVESASMSDHQERRDELSDEYVLILNAENADVDSSVSGHGLPSNDTAKGNCSRKLTASSNASENSTVLERTANQNYETHGNSQTVENTIGVKYLGKPDDQYSSDSNSSVLSYTSNTKTRKQRHRKMLGVKLVNVKQLTGDRTCIDLLDYDEAVVQKFWKDWKKPATEFSASSAPVGKSTQNRLIEPNYGITERKETPEQALKRKENQEKLTKTATALRMKLREKLQLKRNQHVVANYTDNNDEDSQKSMDKTDDSDDLRRDQMNRMNE